MKKNEDGRFKKVVSVSEEIDNDKVPEFFCFLKDHFWKDDYTIYFYMDTPKSTDLSKIITNYKLLS